MRSHPCAALSVASICRAMPTSVPHVVARWMLPRLAQPNGSSHQQHPHSNAHCPKASVRNAVPRRFMSTIGAWWMQVVASPSSTSTIYGMVVKPVLIHISVSPADTSSCSWVRWIVSPTLYKAGGELGRAVTGWANSTHPIPRVLDTQPSAERSEHSARRKMPRHCHRYKASSRQVAAQQRHAPDAAARPEIGGILQSDFVPTVVSIQWCGAGDAKAFGGTESLPTAMLTIQPLISFSLPHKRTLAHGRDPVAL
jgi:hypothetical protein